MPTLDPSFVLRAIRRRALPLAVAGALAAAAAGWTVWAVLPARQPAAAVVHVSAQPSYLFKANPDAQIDPGTYRQRQQFAVKSRRVLEAVFERPEVRELPLSRAPDRVEALDQMIQVDFKLGQEFMRISVDAGNSADSLTLAGAVRHAYLFEIGHKERDRAEELLASKERLVGDWEATLARMRGEFDQKLTGLNLTRTDAQMVPILLRRDLDLQIAYAREAQQTQFRSGLLRDELGRIEKRDMDATVATDDQLSDELVRNESYQALRARTRGAEQVLAANEAFAKPGADLPILAALRTDVTVARRAEDEYKGTVRAQLTARVREQARAERASEVAQRQRDLELLGEWERSLAKELTALAARVSNLNQAALLVDAHTQQVGRLERQIDDGRTGIQNQRQELMAPFRVTPFEEPALVPANANRRRLMYSGLAALAALATVGGTAVGFELVRNRVSHANQLTAGLSVPLLGELPSDRSAGDGVRGACDGVRAFLLHALGAPTSGVLAATSAEPGGGKTALAVGLAGSLGRAGYRTLLVDGDLRAPGVHTALGVPPAPGLAEVMRGGARFESCIRSIPGLGADVLTAGAAPAQGSEAHVSGWAAFLAAARARYDFVVVDAPPVAGAADPLLLSRACSGLILSVTKDESRLRAVAECVALLRRLDLPLVGCVFHHG